MKKVLLLVVALAALYHFKPELFSFGSAKGAFDAKGNPEVVVFTIDNCSGLCEKSVQEIQSRNIPFTELPMDGNEANQKRYAQLGSGGFPYMVAGKQRVQGFDKAMIASALAQTYGDTSLTWVEQKYYRNHFYDDGSPMVYMYGASWCGYCKKMREEFANRKMDYEELDVETAADKGMLTDAMQISGYPTIYVGYMRVQGSNIDEVLQAVKVAGNRKI